MLPTLPSRLLLGRSGKRQLCFSHPCHRMQACSRGGDKREKTTYTLLLPSLSLSLSQNACDTLTMAYSLESKTIAHKQPFDCEMRAHGASMHWIHKGTSVIPKKCQKQYKHVIILHGLQLLGFNIRESFDYRFPSTNSRSVWEGNSLSWPRISKHVNLVLICTVKPVLSSRWCL